MTPKSNHDAGAAAAISEANGVRLAQERLDALRARDRRMAADLAVEEAALDKAAAAVAAGVNPDAEKHFLAVQARVVAKREDQAGFRGRVLPLAVQALTEAQAAAAEAGRARDYSEAAASSAALVERLKADYPRICGQLADLVAVLAAGEAIVEAVNRNLPAGASPLRSPEEMVRDRPRREAAELSRERVELWVREGSTEPLAGGREAQLRVQSRQGDGRGTLVVHDQAVACELWAFWKVIILPAAPWEKGPRLADLFLPGLRPGEPAFLAPERRYQHFAEAAGGSGTLPGPKIEYLPIGRVAASRG